MQDQSQRSILSHECCYHNFSRKLQGVNEVGNHKQLLLSVFSNYAVLAIPQCGVNEFLCNKRLQRKLPDSFPYLRNGVWPRETNPTLGGARGVGTSLVPRPHPRREEKGSGYIPPDPRVRNQHTIVSDHVLTYAVYGILSMPRGPH